jgi:hypothetical protein
MQKLIVMTFVLLLIFSGSVIASPSQKDSNSQPYNAPVKTVEKIQQETLANPEGYLCWRCTSYAYYDGYRVCVSGVWLTNCPVSN